MARLGSLAPDLSGGCSQAAGGVQFHLKAQLREGSASSLAQVACWLACAFTTAASSGGCLITW